jgi:hypothetical protein
MNNTVKFGAIGAFVVLLGVGGYVASKMEEVKTGDACETYKSSSCAGPDGACLVTPKGQYCSRSCAADSDCPAAWACADISSETYSGKTGEKTATASKKMCVKK